MRAIFNRLIAHQTGRFFIMWIGMLAIVTTLFTFDQALEYAVANFDPVHVSVTLVTLITGLLAFGVSKHV